MAKKLLKAVSPIAALADGGIKGVMQNFSPMYNLVRGKDDENDSMLNDVMKQGAAGRVRGMKKGGKATTKPKAKVTAKKGGRGDGIAQRGKTRGKFV